MFCFDLLFLLFCTYNILIYILLYINVKIIRIKSAYFDIVVCFQRGPSSSLIGKTFMHYSLIVAAQTKFFL
jgi:hypothetical protein